MKQELRQQGDITQRAKTRAMKSEGLAFSRAEAHQMQICDPSQRG